jgi:hypothetical protein
MQQQKDFFSFFSKDTSPYMPLYSTDKLSYENREHAADMITSTPCLDKKKKGEGLSYCH